MGKACKLKPVKQVPLKSRRIFDETFKREAVNHWLTSGKSAEVIGEELGLDANPGSPADLQARLDAALRAVRHLREQRDILKKRRVFSPNHRPARCPD